MESPTFLILTAGLLTAVTFYRLRLNRLNLMEKENVHRLVVKLLFYHGRNDFQIVRHIEYFEVDGSYQIFFMREGAINAVVCFSIPQYAVSDTTAEMFDRCKTFGLASYSDIVPIHSLKDFRREIERHEIASVKFSKVS